MSIPTLRKWAAIGFLVLLLNAAYVWAFAFPTIFYMANVLVHLTLGVALFALFVWLLGRDTQLRGGSRLAAGSFLLALLIGAYIVGAGNTLDHRWALWGHIGAALVGTFALFVHVWRRGQFE